MISLLSEKRMSVPELGTELAARRGFSVIATANTRDRGVNDMSAALKRRFNIVVLPTPKTLEMEIDIVRKRVTELAASLSLRAKVPAAEAIEKVVTIFRELRQGQTLDGKNKLKTPVRRALHRGGHLGAGQQHGAGRQLRLRRGDGATTWPPGCRARSSRTRRRTASPGRST